MNIRKLAGEHEALGLSADIHLIHKDWEYDRYSSIGFYLHDRRGDWMKLWRLTKLYDNNAAAYRNFIQHALNQSLIATGLQADYDRVINA